MISLDPPALRAREDLQLAQTSWPSRAAIHIDHESQRRAIAGLSLPVLERPEQLSDWLRQLTRKPAGSPSPTPSEPCQSSHHVGDNELFWGDHPAMEDLRQKIASVAASRV
ncbi:MAG: hypothetical protein ACKN9U_16005, partial [Pirellulaceae bacterium]